MKSLNYGQREKKLPKPEWLRIRPPTGKFDSVKQTVARLGLNTVCTSAHCPNQSECWGCGTATFMILGNTCTRVCRFCAVSQGKTGDLINPTESHKVAEAVNLMKLKYVVLTSVDRDDLPDGGASQFASCTGEIRASSPDSKIEVLIPDFGGDLQALQAVIDAGPDVIGHNIETVARLQPIVRDRKASYKQSLQVLEFVKKTAPQILTKSSIMLGLGETEKEVIQAMEDLRQVGVKILTLGQYLQPSDRNLPVQRYWTPQEFDSLRKIGLKLGFKKVFAGPFVRSSYRAIDIFAR